MTDHTPHEPSRAVFHQRIEEMKDGIARLIAPHASTPGSGGIVTMALLELAIERHLRMFPDEKSARALLDGVLRKVLDRRAASDGD